MPTLRDVWATAPYLHDGSALTLAAAVQAHQGNAVAGTDLDNLVAYLQQLGAEEPGFNLAPSTGTGLQAAYYATNNLSGAVVLQRVEAPNFNWGTAAPATGVPKDNFSIRWTGWVEGTTAGTYQFQTNSDDGVRMWLNGQRVIENWTYHSPTLDTTGTITLAAGQRIPIIIEYQEQVGGAQLQLRWKPPGAAAFAVVPVQQLYIQQASGTAAPPPPNAAPTAALTAPANGASFTQGTAITVSANAADSDGSIARVEFYDGATLIGSDTSPPYSVAWSGAAAGSHTLTARAFDSAGATATSAPVTINVDVAANAPPSVSLTAPADGTGFSQGTAITVSANAADSDGSIARVEFYDGATLIGSDTSAPYSVAWSGAAAGPHTITARAVDNAAATTTSAAVVVSVNAPSAAGTGLQGSYYGTNNLSGSVKLQRVEAVNFNWGAAAPGTGVPADNFSARWTGYVLTPSAGAYQFQTVSDDGVRVFVNGQQVISNWTYHSPTRDTSAAITLPAGQRVPIVVEYQDQVGYAQIQLLWKPPGATAFTVVPAASLYVSP